MKSSDVEETFVGKTGALSSPTPDDRAEAGVRGEVALGSARTISSAGEPKSAEERGGEPPIRALRSKPRPSSAPYYQDDSVTIYHGDCQQVLPDISADVVLTDPPWKMKAERPGPVLITGGERAHELWGEVAPLLLAKRLLLWLPVHEDPRPWLNPIPTWPYLRLIYIRRAIPGYFGRVLMDGEVIHALGDWPGSRKGRRVIPGGMSITYVASDRENGHPGPRSLIAARWLLEWWSDPGDTVVDPFMGSGTTLRAAKDLGRKSIGIEIEERYCEIAANRMGQEVLAL